MTSLAILNSGSSANAAVSDRRRAAWVWGFLMLLLLAGVPLFLCLPLNDDAAMYDLQASNLLRGGVLYRDILEPNLPGVVWLQALIRFALGPSSLALRAADLIFLAATICLLGYWVKFRAGSSTGLAVTISACVLYYFSTSEWCHCQRDVWLLVPGLAGLTLRHRQIGRLQMASAQFTQARSDGEEKCGVPCLRVGLMSTRTAGMLQAGFWAFCEGLCWGLGVWLKPMIVVPAACCWILSLVFIHSWRQALVDLLGLLLGGMAIGSLGVGWLMWSGAWPYFLTTLIEWNPRYVAAGRENWTLARYAGMQYRFFPWQLIHLAAVPVAVATVVRDLMARWESRKVERSKSPRVAESQSPGVSESKNRRDPETASRTIEQSKSALGVTVNSSPARPSDFSTSSFLATFYLVWLLQSYALQHLFDYVHAGEVLLAITVLAGGPRRRRSWSLVVAGFLATALAISPAMRFERLACWRQCVMHGPSPELYDQLRILPMTDWRDMDRVRQYVSGLGLGDQELTCFNNGLVHLYWLTGNRPSTRYALLESYSVFFSDRHDVLLQALAASPQRYVVSDIRALGVTLPGEVVCPEGPLASPVHFPPPLRDSFPWSQPVVFRAGRYLVHRIAGPLGTLKRQAGWPASREPKDGPQVRTNYRTNRAMKAPSP